MPEKPLVLVADDQPHIVLTLDYLLRTVGARVITATNGQDATGLAIAHKPALVLLDVMMPLIDGYTACRMIREAWGAHAGQIWFLTARGSATDREQAQAVGADRILNKPFDPDQLLKAVKQALAQSAAANAG